MPKAYLTQEEFDALGDQTIPLRELYAERDGGFVADLESSKGWAVEDVAGLKSTLGKKRTEAEQYAKQLANYRDEDGEPLDPGKIRQLLERESEIQGWSPDEKSKEWIDSKVRQIEEKTAKELAEANKRADEATSRLHSTVRDNALTAALAKHKAKDTEVLSAYLRDRIKVEDIDGRPSVLVYDKNGERMVSKRSGSSDWMSVDEYVEVYKGTESGAGFFEGSGAQGSDRKGSVRPAPNRVDTSMPATQRMAQAFKNN